MNYGIGLILHYKDIAPGQVVLTERIDPHTRRTVSTIHNVSHQDPATGSWIDLAGETVTSPHVSDRIILISGPSPAEPRMKIADINDQSNPWIGASFLGPGLVTTIGAHTASRDPHRVRTIAGKAISWPPHPEALILSVPQGYVPEFFTVAPAERDGAVVTSLQGDLEDLWTQDQSEPLAQPRKRGSNAHPTR